MENGHLLASMQVFISVVDSGSFSESARRLGLSQPSVSRQVTALETQLGVRLLQRTTRRISLTEAGQIYYEKARVIQRAVIEAGQSISGYKESPSGLLRISAPHTWTEAKIAPYLGEFLALYPDIKLDIRCNDRISDMIEDRLDLVVRVGHAADSSYIAVPFGHVRLVLCATPEYLQQHGVPKTVSDLQNHNFIAYVNYKTLILNRDQEQQQISVSGSLVVNSVETIINVVGQHVGLSTLPDLLIQRQLAERAFIEVLPEYEVGLKGLAVDQVFALYSSRKHMPAKVRAFLEFFRDKFK